MDPEGLVGVRCGVGCPYPFPPGKGCVEGLCPRQKKNEFFTCNGVFWCILSGTFCPCPCQKNVAFSA